MSYGNQTYGLYRLGTRKDSTLTPMKSTSIALQYQNRHWVLSAVHLPFSIYNSLGGPLRIKWAVAGTINSELALTWSAPRDLSASLDMTWGVSDNLSPQSMYQVTNKVTPYNVPCATSLNNCKLNKE